MTNLSKTAAIVGVAESDEIGDVPNKSALQHHAEAAYNALEDAGLSMKDVDGLLTAGFSTLTTAEYFGIQPSFTDGTSIGGSSFVVHIAHAIAAINAGYCEVALITHGETGRNNRSDRPMDPRRVAPQFEAPYGILHAPVNYSMAANRYMHQYGEERTRQALAEIAVSTRKWARMNPKAMMKDKPMSFNDYHQSRWVSWPFHLFDCCVVTDAGAAVVITSAERAKDMKKEPVSILGVAEGHDHDMISQMPDLTRSIARETGPKALKMAGLTHDDMDLTMIYDSFTYTVLVTLESLGYCAAGEGPDFVADQRTAPGGDFPLNTNGGGLSYTHPGMYGIFTIVEAVRQLRGETGDRQVDNCKTALANGTGGSLSSTGTVILSTN